MVDGALRPGERAIGLVGSARTIEEMRFSNSSKACASIESYDGAMCSGECLETVIEHEEHPPKVVGANASVSGAGASTATAAAVNKCWGFMLNDYYAVLCEQIYDGATDSRLLLSIKDAVQRGQAASLVRVFRS